MRSQLYLSIYLHLTPDMAKISEFLNSFYIVKCGGFFWGGKVGSPIMKIWGKWSDVNSAAVQTELRELLKSRIVKHFKTHFYLTEQFQGMWVLSIKSPKLNECFCTEFMKNIRNKYYFWWRIWRNRSNGMTGRECVRCNQYYEWCHVWWSHSGHTSSTRVLRILNTINFVCFQWQLFG